MAIDDNWRKLIPEQILNAPDVPGVYELSDILQDTLYIGHTSGLNQTIQQIADRKDPDLLTATFFRFAATKDQEQEYQKLLDEYKEKNGDLPPINKKKEQG
jgi:excinuclease UvrABC nuclease subunit